MYTHNTRRKIYWAAAVLTAIAAQLFLWYEFLPGKFISVNAENLPRVKYMFPASVNSPSQMTTTKSNAGRNSSGNHFNDKQGLSRITQNSASPEAVVVIKFKNPVTNTQITKATLKYNKDFAYSFTFDDGKRDAYTNAYPLLAGGTGMNTGATYPGLFYTDGCGNKITFRAAIAMNSVSANGNDPHDGSVPESLSWWELHDLYINKWDVLNHSYSHQYGPGTDYASQVSLNTSYIKSKTGIETTHFVIPSGDSEYTTYAFNAGMKAVYNQKDFPGGSGLVVDAPLSLDQFKFYRQYLDDNNYPDQAAKVDSIAARSSATSHLWYSEFTHHVALEPEAGGLLFATFKSHMEELAATYGAGGKDNMWMAPLQEVYEYLSVRELSNIHEERNGNEIVLHIDFSNVPADLSKYALSLRVISAEDIESVTCTNASGLTFKGTGPEKLINLEWSSHPSLVIAGVQDQGFAEAIHIFPNPVENELMILSPGTDLNNISITLVSETGMEYPVASHASLNGKLAVDIRKLHLPKGVYILKIRSEDGRRQFSQTILKE